MKISQVAISDLKQYANVFHNDDDNIFTSLLIAAKQFIQTYTGIPLSRPASIPNVNPIHLGDTIISGTSTSGYTITVTFGDGKTTGTATVATDGTWTVNVPTNITINRGDRINVTHTTPDGNVSAPTIVSITSDSPIITPSCLDDFEDVTIALFVLANDMYDNRDFMVDNNKVNFVVKQILDSHSVNYL